MWANYNIGGFPLGPDSPIVPKYKGNTDPRAVEGHALEEAEGVPKIVLRRLADAVEEGAWLFWGFVTWVPGSTKECRH